MIYLSATRCNCIATLLVSLVSFVATTLCVASQRVFIVVDFVIDSVRKLFDTPPYKLDDRYSRVLLSAGAGNFSHHRVQNSSGAHPTSYPMGTRGPFLGGKAAGTWS
jgi:hypothetical protein